MGGRREEEPEAHRRDMMKFTRVAIRGSGRQRHLALNTTCILFMTLSLSYVRLYLGNSSPTTANFNLM